MVCAQKIYCMKQSTLFIVCVALMSLLILPSCGGGGGNSPDPPPPPAEVNLAVTLNPADGSVQPPALGPTFPLSVTITSTMPPSGVKIDVSAKKDDGTGAAPFYSTSVNSTSATNNFSITGTPANVLILVEVKVTSLTKPTNIWAGSYRYTSK